MGRVVRLDEWRRRNEAPQDRLARAVARLEGLLGAEARRRAPAWLRTEMLAIQGSLAIGLVEDAAERAERLAERVSSRGTG